MVLIDKASLPQHAYEATQVQANEPKIASLVGVSMYQLMERAGESLFEWLSAEYENSQPLLILCGKGNNGGDGYVLGRLALESNYHVNVMVMAAEQEIKGDALIALQHLKNSLAFSAHNKPCQLNFLENPEDLHLSLQNLLQKEQYLVVDAIFGIGFKGKLNEATHHIITAINDSNLPVLSVDIPSGLSADTGTAYPLAVKADVTISFIAMKKGLLTGRAVNFTGQLLLADLGVGESFQQNINSNVVIQNQLNLPRLKPREPATHKGNIGHAVCIGGNAQFPGAIRLSGESALRAGASLVSVACHKESAALIFYERPEFMLAPHDANDQRAASFLVQAKVVILGPGLGKDAWAKAWFEQVMLSPSPQVVDADGLRLLSESPNVNHQRVLTPHPGEAASLLHCDIATIENNRFSSVKAIAQNYGGICLLKGPGTLISDGNRVWVNTTGNPGMASGGMGDVLSGLVGALMIQIPDMLEATRLAVYIHGQAADILAEKEGMNGMLASDLLPVIRRLLNELAN